MTGMAPEPISNPNPGSGNVHWDPLLKLIPEMYHEQIKPILQKWDQGTAQRFTEIHQQYSGFKPFIDNKVDPDRLAQAIAFVDNLENNPLEVVKQVDQAWNLNLAGVYGQTQQNQNPDPNDPYSNIYTPPNQQNQNQQNQQQSPVDIANHPMMMQMMQQMQQMQNMINETAEAQQEREETEAFEKEIKDFLGDDSRKHVDPTVFASFRAAGLDNDTALAQYNTFVAGLTQQQTTTVPNQNQVQVPQQQTQTPVVMGGTGNVGSGTVNQPPKFGDLSPTDTNSVVTQFLQNAANQNS